MGRKDILIIEIDHYDDNKSLHVVESGLLEEGMVLLINNKLLIFVDCNQSLLDSMKVLLVDNQGVVVDRLAHMLRSLSFARVVNQLIFSYIQQLGI